MLHEGLLPDVIIYHALTSAKKGTLPHRTLQLFEQRLHQGLLPDVIICNALFNASGTGTLPQSTLQLFEQMLHQGLRQTCSPTTP